MGKIKILMVVIFMIFTSQLMAQSDYTSNNAMLEIAKGNVLGHSIVHKFGRNAAVGTAFEDIWDAGGSYSFLTDAKKLFMSSSEDSDSDAVMVIQGLDSNWTLQTVTDTLNTSDGETQTEITTSGTATYWIRVFRAYVSGADSLDGDFYVYDSTGASVSAGVPATATTIKAKITQGYNQTEMAIYSVPAGYTAYIIDIWSTVVLGTTKVATLEIETRAYGGVFRNKSVFGMTSSGSSILLRQYQVPLEVAAKSDIKLKAFAAAATDVAGGFDIVLVLDDQ